jgi:hypothetical protein
MIDVSQALMGQNQGQPPAAPQATGQPPMAGQAAGVFPSGPDEERKLSNDLLQVLYDERINANIISQIESIPDQVPLGHGLGIIAAQLLGNRFGDVFAQTGRQIDVSTAARATQAVVGEIVGLAAIAGREIAPEDAQLALRTTIEALDQMAGTGQAPGQAPPMGQAPQGM